MEQMKRKSRAVGKNEKGRRRARQRQEMQQIKGRLRE